MSRRERFGVVAVRAATTDLTKDAMRLYLVLAAYADSATRVARPGQDRLADELGWCSSTTGEPDRRRVYRALKVLEEADLVRKAGQFPLGRGRWVRQVLVAPFPVDAVKGDASSVEAGTDPPEDAYIDDASPRVVEGQDHASEGVSEVAMRIFSGDDAYVSDGRRVHSARAFPPVVLPSSSSSHQSAAAEETQPREKERPEDWERQRQKAHGPEYEALIAEGTTREARANAS